jgi:hypothetical protein
MSNARVQFEMGAERRAAPAERGGREVPIAPFNGEGKSSRRVLDPDRTPWTLILFIHEEVVS